MGKIPWVWGGRQGGRANLAGAGRVRAACVSLHVA